MLVTMCSCCFEYTAFLDEDSKSNIENEISSPWHENQMCIYNTSGNKWFEDSNLEGWKLQGFGISLDPSVLVH